MPTPQTLAIAVVVLATFFDSFAQFPVVAPYARSLGATPATVGLVVALYSATNLVGNVVAGYLLDRFGRKRLLVLGLLAAAGAVLLYVPARDPSGLAAVRAVHGLAASVGAPAAFTLLGDLTPRADRGRAMGLSGGLIALAAMLAPPLSGAIRDRFGYAAVFQVIAALLVAVAVLAAVVVPETRVPADGRQAGPPARLSVLARRPLLLVYGVVLAFTYGLGTLVTYLPLLLADLGYRGAQTGSVFSGYALVALVVMVSPLSRAGERRGRTQPLVIGLLLIGLSTLTLTLPRDLFAFAAALGVFGAGFGLIFPAANARVADATAPGERGTAFGVFYAVYSLGVILGSVGSGLIADAGGVLGLSPFVPAGLLALAAAPLLVVGQKTAEPAVSAGDGPTAAPTSPAAGNP